MGGGSTVAAALAVGYDSIGIEDDPTFFKIAERAIPQLVEFGAREDRTGPKKLRRLQGTDSVTPVQLHL